MSVALIKKRLFEETLNGLDADYFEVIEGEESFLFKSSQNMKNGRAMVYIILDNSIFSNGYIHFASLDDVGKKEKVLRLFNELNSDYKAVTFFINEENVLVAKTNYITTENNFDGKMYWDLVVHAFKTVEEEYPKIMRVVWS